MQAYIDIYTQAPPFPPDTTQTVLAHKPGFAWGIRQTPQDLVYLGGLGHEQQAGQAARLKEPREL